CAVSIRPTTVLSPSENLELLGCRPTLNSSCDKSLSNVWQSRSLYGNVQSQRHAKDNVHVNSSPQHLTLLLEHSSGFSRRGTWQIEIRKTKVDVASQAAVASLEA